MAQDQEKTPDDVAKEAFETALKAKSFLHDGTLDNMKRVARQSREMQEHSTAQWQAMQEAEATKVATLAAWETSWQQGVAARDAQFEVEWAAGAADREASLQAIWDERKTERDAAFAEAMGKVRLEK